MEHWKKILMVVAVLVGLICIVSSLLFFTYLTSPMYKMDEVTNTFVQDLSGKKDPIQGGVIALCPCTMSIVLMILLLVFYIKGVRKQKCAIIKV